MHQNCIYKTIIHNDIITISSPDSLQQKNEHNNNNCVEKKVRNDAIEDNLLLGRYV
jgi:hypothetical protein